MHAPATERPALLLKIGSSPTRPRPRSGSRRPARRPATQRLRAGRRRFPGTPWGEEALLSLANHYQKDALDDGAAPWWQRLLAEYPDGRYAERAAWRVGWRDYRPAARGRHG
jgi:outer membrane protein assembly factor BamD (BamD/ComL family)